MIAVTELHSRAAAIGLRACPLPDGSWQFWYSEFREAGFVASAEDLRGAGAMLGRFERDFEEVMDALSAAGAR